MTNDRGSVYTDYCEKCLGVHKVTEQCPKTETRQILENIDRNLIAIRKNMNDKDDKK